MESSAKKSCTFSEFDRQTALGDLVDGKGFAFKEEG